MKKKPVFTILIVLSIVAISSLHAQRPPMGAPPAHSSLTVSSSHLKFWLFLDDVQQNKQPAKFVKMDFVPEGKHYLRVEMDNREHVTIGQYVEIGRFGNNFTIDKQHNLYGISIGHNSFDQHQPHPDHFPAAMNERDFQRALSVIKNEKFENTKLSTAKQVVSGNLLTVNQISRICQLFEFDNTRLDFAKTAYFRCVDQNQYYLLNSVFEFDNSKKELDKFIQQQK
jgi:hypothetical protein